MAEDRGAQRSRRRFARRQWRRRWQFWRLVLVAVVVVAVAGFGIWAVYGSSWLRLKSVDVTGLSATGGLSAAQVTAAADVPTGRALVTVDLAPIRARVAAIAEVASVDVSREWPDRVRIAVTERTPVAAVMVAGGYHDLDADGVVFRDFRTAPAGLPLVVPVADASQGALREAAEVAAALPAPLAARVGRIQVATVDAITLDLRSGSTVQWGSSTDSALKAQVLAELIAQAPAHSYDVSVPGHPTTHP